LTILSLFDNINIADIELYSKEDCITEFNNLIEANPDKIISRDFFRSNASIPEFVWIKHFGTFTEFKRAVGILPTRLENSFNSQVARHASVDKLREFNEEKRSWEGIYLNPCKERFQSILVGSDMHDIECDPFYLRLFIETAKRVQPSKIILNGDIFDAPEFGKYNVDPRNYRVVERVTWVQNLFKSLREVCPNTEINFIEGNHEARFVKYIAEQSPGFMILLSDIYGMKIQDILGLTKYHVNYYANANLATFNNSNLNIELEKNSMIVNEQILFHHFPVARNYGMPGCTGHNHKFQSWNFYNPVFGSYQFHQIGCGHKRRASYADGQKWQNGFALCHLDIITKRTQFELIDTTNQVCVIGGVFYQRNKKEMESYI
jgi:hypothetical protein